MKFRPIAHALAADFRRNWGPWVIYFGSGAAVIGYVFEPNYAAAAWAGTTGLCGFFLHQMNRHFYAVADIAERALDDLKQERLSHADTLRRERAR